MWTPTSNPRARWLPPRMLNAALSGSGTRAFNGDLEHRAVHRQAAIVDRHLVLARRSRSPRARGRRYWRQARRLRRRIERRAVSEIQTAVRQRQQTMAARQLGMLSVRLSDTAGAMNCLKTSQTCPSGSRRSAPSARRSRSCPPGKRKLLERVLICVWLLGMPAAAG